MVSLSIVIPVYNEREGIRDTLEEIRRAFAEEAPDTTYEIIVVDDGSDDGTAEVLRDCRGIRLFTHGENRGYGAALKTGIRRAEGEAVAITDADGTYPNRMIPALHRRLLEEGLDMLVAARTGKDAKIPLSRRPAKWILNRLADYLSGRKIPDLNSGLRVFRRAAALPYFHLVSDGFSFTTTITLAMLSDDRAVAYHPVSYARRKGRSKIRPLRDTLNFLILMVRTIAFFNPLKIFLPLSLVIFLAAVACLAWQVLMGNVGDLSVLLVVSALQIFLIGIIADLVTRRRPGA